jgi:putative protease
LRAPAGNFESLQAALDNGADSIYFGVEQLNMRARASINFTLDDLEEIQKRSGSIMVVITLQRKKSIG